MELKLTWLLLFKSHFQLNAASFSPQPNSPPPFSSFLPFQVNGMMCEQCKQNCGKLILNPAVFSWRKAIRCLKRVTRVVGSFSLVAYLWLCLKRLTLQNWHATERVSRYTTTGSAFCTYLEDTKCLFCWLGGGRKRGTGMTHLPGTKPSSILEMHMAIAERRAIARSYLSYR